MNGCRTCQRYELMGMGQHCPCVHINGRCTTHAGPRPAPLATAARAVPALPAVKTNNRSNMRKGIYAVYDNKAQDFPMPMLQLHAHEATAVRMFTDLALVERSQIQQHPDDFDLVRLGWLQPPDAAGYELTDDYTVVMTGRALITALQNQNTKDPANAS